MRSYNKVQGMAEEWDAPDVAQLLRNEVRRYCAANARYSFNNKSDFANKCRLSPKCRDWVEASTTQFFPFNSNDPTNKIVLSVFIGPKHAINYVFQKKELTTSPR